MPASALYVGRVMHHRLRPLRHRFTYRLFSLLLDLDEIDALDTRLWLFSRRRFNLFSFHDRDHGDGTDRPLREQITAQLAEAGLPHGGPIRVLTMPRVLGFVFNPLSVWFCHDRANRLSAIIYEVNNTFGERHAYLLAANVDTDGLVRQNAAKAFHVSPFLPMAMTYGFRVAPPDATLALSVVCSDTQGPVLTAVHRAARRPLTDGALARVFVSHPLLTGKVVSAILWEALRLWARRVPVFDHPGRQPASVTPASKEFPCS